MPLPPFPPEFAQAADLPSFGAALANYACTHTQAHGVQVWLGDELAVMGSSGRGLALSDGTLAAQALGTSDIQQQGMLSAFAFGEGVLEFVGADREAVAELAQLRPLLALALEGVQARESRRGRGRVAETVDNLVRRMGGSLDLGEVLTATAESAAQALGFGRAFVGLFSELQEDRARTAEVFKYNLDDQFTGGIGIGPVSYERLIGRGEVIHFERLRDAETPLARGLAELNPEVALIAPLSARGTPLGVLYVDSQHSGARVLEDDTWLVLALAEQASLFIDNARRYATETRKREAAEALREAGAALASSLHLSDTLLQVMKRATALFGAEATAVYELQKDRRSLKIRSALGLTNEYILRGKAKVGSGVTGQAAALGERVTAYDLPQDALGGSSRYTKQLLAQGQYPYRGVVGLPLVTRAGIFGVLTLYWAGRLPLDNDELALTEVFAAQASLAIENARLYEEELRREREAAVLLQVGQLLAEDQSDETLCEIVRLTVTALHAGRGLLTLLDGEGHIQRTACYHLHQPAPSELASLQAQLGRGPRALTRKYALPIAGSALIVPLLGDTAQAELLGFLYVDDPSTELPGDQTLQLSRSIAAQLAQTLSRERLLLALAREEARYRQLAEGAHDLILSADATGEITYANPAATALLTPLTGPLVGASLLNLPSAGTRSALAAAWAQANAHLGGKAEITIGPHRLEVRLSSVQRGDEGHDILAVARDLSELQTLAEEIQRRGQALEAATSRQSELRTFLTLFTQAQEEERRRISRELHDDTAQVLIASSRRVARLARELSGPQKERADDILGDLNAAIESVRRFARNLRPSVLDDLGLLPALEWLASQAQTETRLEVSGTERRLPPAVELTIFRLVQEALTNVDKHAQAHSAAIRVQFGAQEVQVSVRDNGLGFSNEQAQAKAQAGHLGLTGLRERVALAGGQLSVDSTPGQGSAVTFTLPG